MIPLPPWATLKLLKLVVFGLVVAGAFVTGFKVNDWRRDSQQYAIEQAAEKAGEQASTRAVAAIGKIRPKYVTIQNEVQRETRIEPRYVAAECQHTDAVWMQISAAYETLGYPPLSGIGVPQPSTPSR